VWKVGERVSMVGNVTDPEGDPTTAYWDFDNRTDSNGDGDPTRDRDANGTTAAHVYSAPGNYSIIFWATDGEQKTCLNSNCTNPTGPSPRDAPQLFSVFQEHTYAHPGPYNLALYVSDGNATVNDTKQVFVESLNLPPVLLGLHASRANGTSAGNNTFRINEIVVVTAQMYDKENDTLNASIDWGDGSVENSTIDPKTSNACSLDNQSRNICSVSFSHAYASGGANESREYTALVKITDNTVYLELNTTGATITLTHTKNQID